jgi:hypothetical protein
MQFQFLWVKKYFVKEQAAENDHEERTQDHCVGVKPEKSLYECHIGQHGQRIKDHKPRGQFPVCPGLEGLFENIGVEDEFQRGADIVQPGI